MGAPQQLHVHLVGEFGVVHGSRPVAALDSPRLQALVARLALPLAIPVSRTEQRGGRAQHPSTDGSVWPLRHRLPSTWHGPSRLVTR